MQLGHLLYISDLFVCFLFIGALPTASATRRGMMSVSNEGQIGRGRC
jgi:hypothetical protein